MDLLKTKKALLGVTAARFIDEYRLLYITQGKLMLLDSSVGGDLRLVEFELERGVEATKIERSYELNNGQPFRVNPEEGIVLLTVKPPYSPSQMLVIPTHAFLTASDSVGWLEWAKSAAQFPTFSSEVFVLHTQILRLETGLSEGIRREWKLTDSTVYDFSRYSRKLVAREEPSTLASGYLPKGFVPCLPSSRLRQPLAAAHGSKFCWDATYGSGRKYFPTENGVLLLQTVRISLVGKREF